MNFKALDSEELDALLDGVRFPTPPLHHQKVLLVWAAATGRRLSFWGDIGTGKTLGSVYLARKIWEAGRVLVVCPNCVVEGWDEQLRDLTDERYELLTGRAEERRARLADSSANIFVLNYEGLKLCFGAFREGGKNKRGERMPGRWGVDRSLVRAAGFDCVVFDEAHHLTNPRAVQTRIAHALSERAARALIMTGSPYNQGMQDLWTEYWCLDGGLTLGGKRSGFLARYFDRDYFGKPKIKGRGAREQILDRVAPVTLRYSREECFELPERAYEERWADATAEQEMATLQIMESEIDPLQRANALAQIAGGFRIVDGVARRFPHGCPREALLLELLGEIGGRKAVVFHSYIEEGRMIEEALGRAGISYASRRGEIADKAEQTWRFRNTPKCRVLVCHPASGGEGLNLQEASVAVFYGNGVGGAAVRDQCEGRIWRHGQRRACLYVDLGVRGTVDEARLQRARDRSETARRVLAYVERYAKSSSLK